jgi:hypothetical protein
MKTIFSKIIIASSFVLVLASCKTYSHSSRIVDISTQDVVADKFVVDVEPNFTKRIKGSSTKKHKVEKLAKDEAYFNAIIDNNIDILVDPIYSVTTTKRVFFIFGGKSEATVHGYAGFYKNPRSLNKVKQEEFETKISNITTLSKIQGIQQETEEKTYSVNPTCGDCKGNDPLSLIAITKNKESLVDVYEKLSDPTSKDSGAKSFFKKDNEDSSSKNKSIISKLISKIKSIVKK